MLSSAPANAVATALWKPALIVSLLFQSRGLNSRLTRMSIPTLNTPCVAINRWFGRTRLSPVPHSRPLCICTLSVKKIGITAKRRCSYSCCCWSHREEIAAVAAAWLVDDPLAGRLPANSVVVDAVVVVVDVLVLVVVATVSAVIAGAAATMVHSDHCR